MKDLGHGRRITEKEYERRIVALYDDNSPFPALNENELRRRELDIAVDFRLGVDFPEERRDALWNIQQNVEKKRLRLYLYWVVHFFSNKLLFRRANKLAEYLVREYARVLTKEELSEFFELEENEKPVLPMDERLLKK